MPSNSRSIFSRSARRAIRVLTLATSVIGGITANIHMALLLLALGFPLKAVALQCGITDLQYFSRMFKRIIGVTPKGYQETVAFCTCQEFGNC